jgi:hypothetical protein
MTKIELFQTIVVILCTKDIFCLSMVNLKLSIIIPVTMIKPLKLILNIILNHKLVLKELVSISNF